jgi:hypothetical protein
METIREFMDTALARHLPVDKLDREPEKSSGQVLVKGWYKYSKGYWKGIGMNMVRIGNDWKALYEPEYSMMRRK